MLQKGEERSGEVKIKIRKELPNLYDLQRVSQHVRTQ
jgi:hypothetical protein